MLSFLQHYFRYMWEWFCGFIHWLVGDNCCKIGCKILCRCQDIANLLLGYFNLAHPVYAHWSSFVKFVIISYWHYCNYWFITPPTLVSGRGYCYWSISLFIYLFVSLFVCLFLCLQDYEKTAGPICMKFSGKVWSDHGTTWLHFWSIPRNRAVLFLAFSYIATRGWGLLCFAPQLVITYIAFSISFIITDVTVIISLLLLILLSLSVAGVLRQIGKWFREAFDELRKAPRYLIPCYFDAIVTGVYNIAEEVFWNKMSPYVSSSSSTPNLSQVSTIWHVCIQPS